MVVVVVDEDKVGQCGREHIEVRVCLEGWFFLEGNEWW